MSLGRYYRFHAHIYDTTRWAFLFGRRKLIREVGARIRARRILEVGCGTGTNLMELARQYPAAKITGVDLSADMLAKARRKLSDHGPRVSLLHRAYDEPLSKAGEGFDLIVFSYCLSMINPGYDKVLQVARQDLAPGGAIAIVDFHATGSKWFRRWMAFNHVRFDGHILKAVQDIDGLQLDRCLLESAYGGWWQYLLCVARS
ncbi:O-methyltransferase [Bryobacterales bacterium F-183]|nr:O-methyltransferase [Bryobacterales bacterium F-183]